MKTTLFLSCVIVFNGFAAKTNAYQLEAGPYSFTEVSADKNLEPFVNDIHGGGVAIEDIDDDGDYDLFLAQSFGNPPQFYTWDQQGDRYLNRTVQAGLDGIPSGRTSIFFDYDNDGRLDLLVGTENTAAPSAFMLYRQSSNMSFTDVTAAAGLTVTPEGFNRSPLAVADINNDGFPDFWSGMWDQMGTAEGSLFVNNGDGTFTDITDSSGILVDLLNTNWQAMWHDFDHDGFQDLYLAVDFARNRLFQNQGDLTFHNLAPSAKCANSMNDMGLALADYDEDGDFDIYITNIHTNGNHNVLYRNDTVDNFVTFTDVSIAAGVDDGGWGWGTTFFDADNDGHLDLVGNNGFALPPDDTDPTIFHRGFGNGTFTPNRAKQVGLEDTQWTVGVIAYDFDLDGDQDLFQTTNNGNVRLMQNDSSMIANRNHLVIRPRLNTPNRWAIGSVVRATTTFNTQARLISAGSSYLSQAPGVAFFGMAHDTVAQHVTVEFSNGQTTVLDDVECNQLVEVAPGPLTDVSGVQGLRSGGGLLNMIDSDNSRMQVRGANCAIVAGWQTADFLQPGVTTINVEVECGVDGGNGIFASVELMNWNNGHYESIGGLALSQTDGLLTVNGLSAIDYVNGNGRVQLRLTANAGQQAVRDQAFTLRVDQLVVTAN